MIEIASFFDKDLIKAHHKNSRASIFPKVKALIAARDAVGLQLSTMEGKIADLKGKREVLQQEIEDLRAKGAEAAKSAQGEPLAFNKLRRAKEGEVQDIGAWIADLEVGVEELITQGRSAQLSLYQGWKSSEAIYLKQVQDEFDALHLALSKFHASYLTALHKTHAEIMQEDNFPRSPLPHPQNSTKGQCAL